MNPKYRQSSGLYSYPSSAAFSLLLLSFNMALTCFIKHEVNTSAAYIPTSNLQSFSDRPLQPLVDPLTPLHGLVVVFVSYRVQGWVSADYCECWTLRYYLKMKFFLCVLLLAAVACQTSSEGCLVFVSGSLQCQICNGTLQLDDQGSCRLYPPIDNCNVYNAASRGSLCARCAPNYLLSGGICLRMVANCKQTDNVNSCDICNEGYILIDDSACYSTSVDKCPLGSLPRKEGDLEFCQKYTIVSCGSLAADGNSCLNCTAGYSAVNGVCFPTSSVTACPDRGCLCTGYYFQNSCYGIQLPNCLQSADGVYCDLCADLYQPNNGFCIRSIKNDDPNCNVISTDGQRCTGCNLNYILSPDFVCHKNFQTCPPPCSACPLPNFALAAGNCLFNDPLCSVYDATKQICQRCLEGYSLDPRTLSCAKTTSCLTRDSRNICTGCFTGYQLNYLTLQCVKLPANCLTLNLTTLLCANCTSVTVLSNGNCIFPTANCVAYNLYGYCLNCSAGFVQVNRNCLPLAPNCDAYLPNDNSKCQLCAEGFHLSASLCYLNVEGCTTYVTQSQCGNCQAGYLLINATCYYSDPNCQAQDANGLCLACLNGFLPARSRCVYFDPFCLAYDPATMVCSQTLSAFSPTAFPLQQQLAYLNFIMQANAASSSPLDSAYSGGASGSYTKNGLILTLPPAGLSSSSIGSYSFNGNVLSCKAGFSLVEGQCVTKTANCDNYNQFGTCSQCDPGYDLVSDNLCALRSPTSCRQQAGGICVQAAAGFALSNGAAVFVGKNAAQVAADGKVLTANAGYFVWTAKNVAWPLDANCAQQTEPGTCLKCSSLAFSLLNGRCVVKKLNCVAYSPYGLCQGCSNGFLLFAGECRASNCLNLDLSSGLCLACSNNYTLWLGSCLQKRVANCLGYSPTGCLFCAANFYLTSSSLCGKMINFCQTANSQTGRCLQCVGNYTLYLEQCIPLIPNCQVYAANLTSCATCATLHFPILNSSACSYLGFYCAALSPKGECTTCNAGLTLTQQNGTNICIRPIPNCLWYDANIKCTRCSPNFVLQFNKCKSSRCNLFNLSTSLCGGCLAGFNLITGACIDRNCANYTTGEVCLKCLPRYYLSNGACVLSSDPNCGEYSSAGVCLSCLGGFSLNDRGVCVLSDQLYYGCAKREFPCRQCSVGYILNGSYCYARRCNGYKPNRDCVSCISYYTFQPTQRFCILYTCADPSCYTSDAPPAGFEINATGQLTISFCIAYSGDSCSQCQGYRYPNPSILYNLCYPYNCQIASLLNCPSNCLANFAPTPSYPNVCLASNCSSWDSTGICLQCISTFKLINGACLLVQIANCLTVNYSSLTCASCANGYEAYNDYCRSAFCSNYHPKGILCVGCINGFVLNKDGLCILGKCSQSISPSQCQSCLLGYSIRNSICYANNCTNYDFPTLTCLQCAPGFDLVSGIGICKATNCNSFDNSLFCKSCSAGYGLRPGGFCVSVDPNCASFDASGNCLACKDTKQYTNVADVCVFIVVGCLQYSKTGCTLCSPAYSLTNGLCSVKYCRSYLTPEKCTNCQRRYTLLGDGTCVPSNCLSFSGQTWACLQCEPRFQLVDSLFCFTSNCSVYQNYHCSQCQPGFALLAQTCTFANCPTPTAATCPTCLSGFSLANGVCQVPSSSCASYDQQNLICLSCQSGYNLTALGTCVLTQLPDANCVAYNPQTMACSKCLPNYSYNPQAQQCESSLCLRYSSPNPVYGRTCTGCIDGFTLDSVGKYCFPAYCKSYAVGTGVCSACVGGASLTTGICYASRCANYSTANPNSPMCLGCQSGYQLTASFLCAPSNCQTLTGDLNCLTCSSGFALNSGGLCISTQCQSGFVFQNFNCVPANCVNVTRGSCQQCLPGFLPQRQSCVAQGCIKFNSQYICQQCRAGYNLALVGGQYLCSLNFTPSCPSGYYLSNSACIAIPLSNCSVSDNSASSCLRCADGFFLANGICYLLSNCNQLSYISGCFSCLPGFILEGFLCNSLNCLTLASDTSCASCMDGYQLVGGLCRRSIYQCQQSDPSGNCVLCFPSFQLNQGRCVATGCTSYNPSTYICLTCNTSYVLRGEICQLKAQLPNCYTPQDDSNCAQCNNGYVQLAGKCYPQVANCLNYVNSGNCQLCLSGYYLTAVFQCLVLPSFCLAATPNGQCSNCVSGYLPVSGACQPNVPNCRSFDPNTGLCLSCASSFFLTASSLCQRLPINCLSADRSGACTTCTPNFSVAVGSCVPTIVNCLVYNQNNPAYCYQCIATHYLNTQYTCTLLPPFCSVANNLGYCLTCQPNYQLFSNSLCVLPVSNCSNYVQVGLNGTRCVQCADGYTLTDGYLCSLLPKYCLAGDATGKCLQCATGYQLFSNFCLFAIANCVNYNTSSGYCSSCVGGYYLSQGQGQGYLCSLLPSYCLSADLSGNCLSCLKDYMIYNSRCVLASSILNCQSYNLQTYSCLTCVAGYYLSSTGCLTLPANCASASPMGVCLSCVGGYRLVGVNCVLVIANCTSYSNNGFCLQCASGFALSSDGFTCSLVAANCQVYSPNGQCLQCQPNYYLLSSNCILLPTGCTQLSPSQQCLACAPGYTLVSYLCILNVPNCLYYNPSGCYQCVTYYYLQTGNCYAFPPNCLSYDSALLRCLSCASGFTLDPSTFICSKTVNIPNCLSYTGPQCLSCAPRYFLRQNICVGYPSYCVNVDLAGNCLSCSFGSVFQNGLCVAGAGRSLNCLVFNSTTQLCVTCMGGYSFCPVAGVCLLPDPSCLSLAQDGSCLQCKSIYQLYNGRCLLYPTGVVVAPNGGVSCLPGYTPQNNSCLRSESSLTKLSTGTISFLWSYSSNAPSQPPIVGSNSFWTPARTQLNEYISLSVSSGRPQIIFQVGIKGSGSNYVTAYILHFRNRPDAPFICWNSCNQIGGNTDGNSVSLLQLYHPIVATELRLYPVGWNGQVALQLEVWINNYM